MQSSWPLFLLLLEPILFIAVLGCVLSLQGEPKWSYRVNIGLLLVACVIPHLFIFGVPKLF